MSTNAEQLNEATIAEDGQDSMPTDDYDLELILDLMLDISVELGKVKMPVKELLRLRQGSIIELTQAVGEPLEIYANNKLVAKGEVVILEDKFGIRVSDIINPDERVRTLG